MRSIRGLLGILLVIVVALLAGTELFSFSITSRVISDIQAGNFQDSSAFIDRLRTIESWSFWSFAISLTLILSIFLYVMFVMSQSLRMLLLGIRRVQEGNLSHRVNVPYRNEFGVIGDFFNETAEMIESQVHEKTLQLEHEKQLLSVVLSGIEEGVIALDSGDNITLCNAAASTLLGAKESESLVGRNISLVQDIVYSGEVLDITELTAVSRSNPGEVVFEEDKLELIGTDHKSVFVQMSVKTIRSPSGTDLTVVTIRNMSSEMQIEAMKIDFVAMAAHQLRTPLTAMQGYLHLMIAEVENIEERKRYIKRLLTSIGNLARLVGNLLDASKMEANTFNIAPETVDLQQVVKDAVEEQRTAYADESGVGIKYVVNPEKIELLIDPLYIKEAVGNLLSNAVRNSKHGDHVEVTIEVNDELAEIHVRDNGPGIPERALGNLFQKFYRVYGGLESGSQGTGLGLFITRRIVEQHGGKVWVDSATGKGSTFHIGLPHGNALAVATGFSDMISDTEDRDRTSFGWVKKRPKESSNASEEQS